ncbi:MAG: T9SS type A sorting domain-containing protein [Prolixibacteraceae bacterium]
MILLRNIIICFTLILALYPVSSYSQFPNKNGVWFIESHDPGGTYSFKCEFEKNTNINEVEYSIFSMGPNENRCALRSDSLKVYAINLLDTVYEEFILYDFGLAIGDTFTVVQYFYNTLEIIDTVKLHVQKIDSIKINGEFRKRIYLNNSLNSQIWIEGIGSSFSLLYQYCMTYFEENFSLVCYQENGKTIYGTSCIADDVKNNRLNTTYFSYSNKVLHINNEFDTKVELTIFDCMGKNIYSITNYQQSEIDLSMLSAGYYIVTLKNSTNTEYIRITIN